MSTLISCYDHLLAECTSLQSQSQDDAISCTQYVSICGQKCHSPFFKERTNTKKCSNYISSVMRVNIMSRCPFLSVCVECQSPH